MFYPEKPNKVRLMIRISMMISFFFFLLHIQQIRKYLLRFFSVKEEKEIKMYMHLIFFIRTFVCSCICYVTSSVGKSTHHSGPRSPPFWASPTWDILSQDWVELNWRHSCSAPIGLVAKESTLSGAVVGEGWRRKDAKNVGRIFHELG